MILQVKEAASQLQTASAVAKDHCESNMMELVGHSNAVNYQAAMEMLDPLVAMAQEVDQKADEALAQVEEATSPHDGSGAGIDRGSPSTSPMGTSPRSSRPTKSHGTQQKRAGVQSGPVRFSVPRRLEGRATAAHRREVEEYVDAANKALAEGELSKIGRVRPSKDDELKTEKLAAARRERLRAEKAGEPYGDKVAAHLPDTTWTGTAEPPGGWGRHEEVINSSLGSQSDKYPVGYMPSSFELDETWDTIEPDADGHQ